MQGSDYNSTACMRNYPQRMLRNGIVDKDMGQVQNSAFPHTSSHDIIFHVDDLIPSDLLKNARGGGLPSVSSKGMMCESTFFALITG